MNEIEYQDGHFIEYKVGGNLLYKGQLVSEIDISQSIGHDVSQEIGSFRMRSANATRREN